MKEQSMKKRRILVTAFEPFGILPGNPTMDILARLSSPEGTELIRLVLPVSYSQSRKKLLEAFREEKPDAVLSLGLAANRSKLSIERVAVNLCDSLSADNDGVVLVDAPIVQNGPAAYFSTLPNRIIFNAIKETGIPVAMSETAGTYVCNNVMYSILHEIASNGLSIPAGFIHVPATPETALSFPEMPVMTLEDEISGTMIAVERIVNTLSKK